MKDLLISSILIIVLIAVFGFGGAVIWILGVGAVLLFIALCFDS